MADQISDIWIYLNKILRSCCCRAVATGILMIAGQIGTSCYVVVPRTTRKLFWYYTRAKFGFDYNLFVLTAIDEQSPDIALGVNKSLESKLGETTEDEDLSLGAGDQGLMFGYATNETIEMLPFPIAMAHRLAYRLAEVRKKGIFSYLRPDGKTQVTVNYLDGIPQNIDTIIIAAQHHPDVNHQTIETNLVESYSSGDTS